MSRRVASANATKREICRHHSCHSRTVGTASKHDGYKVRRVDKKPQSLIPHNTSA